MRMFDIRVTKGDSTAPLPISTASMTTISAARTLNRPTPASAHCCASFSCTAELAMARQTWRIERQVFHQQRAWADQAHRAGQDIPVFRHLITAGGAQEPPQPGQPLDIGQRAALRIKGIVHGAEFHYPERLAVPSGPKLAKQHRCPHPMADQQRHHFARYPLSLPDPKTAVYRSRLNTILRVIARSTPKPSRG